MKNIQLKCKNEFMQVFFCLLKKHDILSHHLNYHQHLIHHHLFHNIHCHKNLICSRKTFILKIRYYIYQLSLHNCSYSPRLIEVILVSYCFVTRVIFSSNSDDSYGLSIWKVLSSSSADERFLGFNGKIIF